MLLKQEGLKCGERINAVYSVDGDEYYKSIQCAYQLAGIHIVPGAWYLEMILNVLNQQPDSHLFVSLIVNSFKINKLVVLNESDLFKISIAIQRAAANHLSVMFYLGEVAGEKQLNRQFNLHYQSDLCQVLDTAQQRKINVPMSDSKSVSGIYDKMLKYGVKFSGQFRSIISISFIDSVMRAQIKKSSFGDLATQETTGQWHAVFQALTFYIALQQVKPYRDNIWRIPVGFSEIQIFNLKADSDSIILFENPGAKECTIILRDSEQRPMVCVRGCKLKSINTSELEDMVSTHLNNSAAMTMSAHHDIALQLQKNIQLYCNNKLSSDEKIAIISSVIFLWASKIIPWSTAT